MIHKSVSISLQFYCYILFFHYSTLFIYNNNLEKFGIFDYYLCENNIFVELKAEIRHSECVIHTGFTWSDSTSFAFWRNTNKHTELDLCCLSAV